MSFLSFRKNSTSKKASRRGLKLRRTVNHRMSLERLEDRLVLVGMGASGLLDVTGGALSYTASAGVANNVSLDTNPSTLTLSDSGEPITLSANAMAAGFVNTSPDSVQGPDANVSTILIDTADGNDTITIGSSNKPLTISPTSTSPTPQTIFLGNGTDGVQDITAPVNLLNANSTTALNIDDSNNSTTPRNVTVSNASISGLTGSTISFNSGILNTLDILGGSAGNSFNFIGTAAPTTNITEGSVAASNDYTFVSQLNAGDSLNIVNELGADNVTVGGDPYAGVANVQGHVDVQDTEGSTALTIDDSETTNPNSFTVSDTQTTPGTGGLISYSGNIGPYNLDEGTGTDTVTVTNTIPNQVSNFDNLAGADPLYLEGTGTGSTVNIQGADEVIIGNAGLTSAILGNSVNISNDTGLTQLVVDDSADTVSANVTIGAQQLTGLTLGPINYPSNGIYGYPLNELDIKGGNGGNTFTISNGGDTTYPTNITSGSGNDTFAFANQSNLDDGTIVGGGGSNTLDYSAYTTVVNADLYLNPQTATGTGGTMNIENIIGGSGGNVLVAPQNAISSLTGGSGVDVFIIPADAGDVTVAGDGGLDDLEIYAAGDPESFTLSNPTDTPGSVTTVVTGSPATTYSTHTVNAIGINTLELTGGLIVPGSVAFYANDPGDSTATLDFSSGNPIPAGGLSYSGGGASNSLILEGDLPSASPFSFTNELYTASGRGSGNINLDGSMINFLDLSPIIDSISVQRFTFDGSGYSPADIAITSDPSVNGLAGTLIASPDSPEGFESIAIANKENVTVSNPTTSGSDSTVTLNDSTPGALLSNLAINTGDGNDTFNLVATPNRVPVQINSGNGTDTTIVSAGGLTGPLFITGGGAEDDLQIIGSSGTESFTSSNDGDGDIDTVISSPSGTQTVTAYGINTLEIDGGSGTTTTTLDFSGGNPIPDGGLTFTGVSSASNTLILENDLPTANPYSFINEIYNATGAGAGGISLDGSIINFTGLSPIIDSVTAENFTFNAPNAMNNIAIASDSSVNGFEGTLISSADWLPAFESDAFTNKVNVTVNSLDTNNDTVTVADPTAGALLSTFAINTGAGDDSITLDETPKLPPTVPSPNPFTVNEGGGDNQITVESNGLGGPVSVNGGTGTNSLFYNANDTISSQTTTDLQSGAGAYPVLTYSNYSIIDVSDLPDLPLVNSPTTITVQEGQTYSGAVGSFSESNLAPIPNQINATPSAGDFTATINWGDGSITTGTVVTNTMGGFDVDGSHTYIQAGSYRVTIAVLHGPSTSTTSNSGVSTTLMTNGGSRTSIRSTATVTAAPLTLNSVPVTATEGSPLAPGTLLAQLTDGNTLATPASFSGTVNWGDGTGLFPVSITATSVPGMFLVNSASSHTYLEEGQYLVTVSIKDVSGVMVVSTATASVADAPLTATGTNVNAVEGNSFTAPVATFTDADPYGVVSDYTVSINWGDGTITPGTVTQPGGLGTEFVVTGTHTYFFGMFPITTNITDLGGSTTTATSTANVTGAFLTPGQNASITGTEGAPINSALVGTFSSANPLAVAGDFSTTIDWGDGTPNSAGTVERTPGGTFDVFGSHTYAKYSATGMPYLIIVTVTSTSSITTTLNATATIADAPLTATPLPVNAVEGISSHLTVANFTDADPNGMVSDYTVTIYWGDGTTSTSTAVIITPTGSSPSGTTFTISANHTYLKPGQYSVTTRIADVGGSTASSVSTASVADAPLSATGIDITATEGNSFNGRVATFTDADPNGVVSDYTVSINWGDGTTTPGTVSQPGGTGTPFVVSGTHTYEFGSYPITTTITDFGGSTATTSSTANVVGAPLANGPNLKFSGVEGIPLSSVLVGTFMSDNPIATPGEFTAHIYWGDGTATSTGTVILSSGGVFEVFGSHTYEEELPGAGLYGLMVTVVGHPGSVAILSPEASIADAPLTATPVPVTAVEGFMKKFTVANFIDADPFGMVSDYTVTINWGDGTISNGSDVTITPSGSSPSGSAFSVTANHTFIAAGHYQITTTINDVGGSSATVVSNATVTSAELSLMSTPVTATEGIPLLSHIPLAILTDANLYSNASNFSGSVNWGDGTGILPVTIEPTTTAGTFVVIAASPHTFLEEGDYKVTVSVKSTSGATATSIGTAIVADAPLSSTGVNVTSIEGTLFTAQVARFTDADPYGTVSDYSAAINWGDGVSTPGTVVALQSGVFGVTGTHTYLAEGSYRITVAINDVGGSTTTATSVATVKYSSIVSNTNDSGAGSLRDAILAADDGYGATITFAIAGTTNAIHTIIIDSPLPAITGTTTIDGRSEALAETSTAITPLIQIDGSDSSPPSDGLVFGIQSTASKLFSIAIFGFKGTQAIFESSDDTIQGNYVGFAASTPLISASSVSAESTAVANPGSDGLLIKGSNETIGGLLQYEGNVISGNLGQGLEFAGAGVTGSTVEGNDIGTDPSGKVALPNMINGIVIGDGALGITIGPDNVISGNDENGVQLLASNGNLIIGNMIGTDVAGIKALGNTVSGVFVDQGSTNNSIGGSTSGATNVISGNLSTGVTVQVASIHNVIQYNLIGTNLTGTAAIGNGIAGVLLSNSSYNLVGPSNLISGNGAVSQGAGVWIDGPGSGSPVNNASSSGNIVYGNRIGTDLSGESAIGNSIIGVLVNEASENQIGGNFAGAMNLISGNTSIGVILAGAGASGNLVAGNRIGTDVSGTRALGNGQGGTGAGVYLENAPGNTIGGALGGQGNLISGNNADGIQIFGSGSSGNDVQGNSIGTDGMGIDALGNDGNGVLVNAAPGTEIIANLIAANTSNGIMISGAGSTGTFVQSNLIGAGIGGEILGNQSYGLLITNGAPGAAGSGNLIVNNTYGSILNTSVAPTTTTPTTLPAPSKKSTKKVTVTAKSFSSRALQSLQTRGEAKSKATG